MPKREVLIAVTGLSPQVVTETLYCLTQVRRPPADLSEVWVVTTRAGKATAARALLAPRTGKFLQFCREYGIRADRIRFGPEQILVVSDRKGRPLDDIRTPEDNGAFADFMTSFIRSQTADPERILHCSVAGGRKTMGLYLGLALQLYGRPGDTLSHVLVTPPQVESDPGFFYPPRPPGWVTTRAGRIHSRRIMVELAQVPLLMLRGKLPTVEAGGRSYTALVGRAQQDYALLAAPPRLILDPEATHLVVGDHQVPLSALEMAVYRRLCWWIPGGRRP